MFTVLVLNSLDARYGSTYRLRALAKLLEKRPHLNVIYAECDGSAFKKLRHAIMASFGSHDLIFTQKFNPITLVALVISMCRGLPRVVDWDDFDEGLQNRWIKRWLAKICEALGPTLAQVITTHSELISQKASRVRKTFMVHQGFDPTLFYPDESLRQNARQTLGIKANECAIGHLCTLTSGGALDLNTILEAFAKVKHPRVKFILIGGGPFEKAVRVKVNSLNLSDRFHITGLISHEQAAHTLRALDIGVIFMSDQPSNRARASLKVIEYLALDLPTVGQVVGETRERFGQFIYGANALNLPEVLDKLAKNLPECHTHEAVLNYSWEKSLEALEAALNHAKNQMTP